MAAFILFIKKNFTKEDLYSVALLGLFYLETHLYIYIKNAFYYTRHKHYCITHQLTVYFNITSVQNAHCHQIKELQPLAKDGNTAYTESSIISTDQIPSVKRKRVTFCSHQGDFCNVSCWYFHADLHGTDKSHWFICACSGSCAEESVYCPKKCFFGRQISEILSKRWIMAGAALVRMGPKCCIHQTLTVGESILNKCTMMKYMWMSHSLNW